MIEEIANETVEAALGEGLRKRLTNEGPGLILFHCSLRP
jgi:hypothetical protein